MPRSRVDPALLGTEPVDDLVLHESPRRIRVAGGHPELLAAVKRGSAVGQDLLAELPGHDRDAAVEDVLDDPPGRRLLEVLAVLREAGRAELERRHGSPGRVGREDRQEEARPAGFGAEVEAVLGGEGRRPDDRPVRRRN
jgi:hypothetical protein